MAELCSYLQFTDLLLIAGEQKRARRHILGGGGQRHFLKLYGELEQKSRHILDIPLFFQLV